MLYIVLSLSVFFCNSALEGNSVSSTAPYAEFVLPDNNTVRIHDYSRVYFGDYHHVRLEVSCDIPVPVSPDATGNLPASVVYRRILEKMAVPSASAEAVKQSLLEEFKTNSLPYLTVPDFARKLAARSQAKSSGARWCFRAGSS
jgi:hypothetical protein